MLKERSQMSFPVLIEDFRLKERSHMFFPVVMED
jgi:hypothetical protein